MNFSWNGGKKLCNLVFADNCLVLLFRIYSDVLSSTYFVFED